MQSELVNSGNFLPQDRKITAEKAGKSPIQRRGTSPLYPLCTAQATVLESCPGSHVVGRGVEEAFQS